MLDGFKTRIAQTGGTLAVYAQPTEEEQCDLVKDARRMKVWLATLPARTAVFCAHDRRALQLLGVCLDAGIAVPQTLAVLGSNDDALLCEAMTPSLSSISLHGMQTGRMCARILNDLMNGKKVHPFVDLAYPCVISRQSTDASAIKDSVLAKALHEIRADLARSVSIEELAARLGFSKRTLELKALNILGCTLRDEITRIRLAEATRLLSNTDLSVQEIALKCGFCCASHLGARMKKVFGHPPSTWRYASAK